MGRCELLSTKYTLYADGIKDRCYKVSDQDHVHECMTMINKKASMGSYRFLPKLSHKDWKKWNREMER